MKKFVCSLLVLAVSLCAVSAFAEDVKETWVNIPGEVQFVANDGTTQALRFSRWAMLKSSRAGQFVCSYQNVTRTFSVRNVMRVDLDGDGNPATLTLRDGGQIDVQFAKSFIRALTHLDTFKFVARDDIAGRPSPHEVRSNAIKWIRFN